MKFLCKTNDLQWLKHSRKNKTNVCVVCVIRLLSSCYILCAADTLVGETACVDVCVRLFFFVEGGLQLRHQAFLSERLAGEEGLGLSTGGVGAQGAAEGQLARTGLVGLKVGLDQVCQSLDRRKREFSFFSSASWLCFCLLDKGFHQPGVHRLHNILYYK